MDQKLKIAVVGLGRIGWKFHFAQALASDRFELCAVVDPLPDRRTEAQTEANCETYSDFDALWSGQKLNVVAIASPTTLHEEMTCRAFAKGCHVILEKPMTTSIESADRMIAAARKYNRCIFLYQPHRLTPETQTAREVIQSGLLGPIYKIHRAVYRYVRRNDWQSLRKNGGGMLNNYGAHYMDQLIYLSDASPVAEVECKLWAIATLGDADDVVKAWIKKESGQLLDVEINQASAQTLPGWHICGQYGTAIREGNVFKVTYYNPSEAPPLEIVEGAAPGRSYDNQDRLPWQEREFAITKDKQRDFYANVYDVINNNAEPYIRIEESRELMRILDLCRHSADF
jgi:scyllo-inositol 2-dehydrogenase (NADP+)